MPRGSDSRCSSTIGSRSSSMPGAAGCGCGSRRKSTTTARTSRDWRKPCRVSSTQCDDWCGETGWLADVSHAAGGVAGKSRTKRIEHVALGTAESKVEALGVVIDEAESLAIQHSMQVEETRVRHLGVRREDTLREDESNASFAQTVTGTPQHLQLVALDVDLQEI